uniref:Uncharacterized protein n=1 Tax=Meloidogyne javanica TaxID=6303 RepID=A0A915LY60_MELJA
MGTKPSKLRHLLHQQKYSSNKNYSPQLNLKKNKLIILKRAVAGASYTATTKWKNNNKSGSIIELIDDIELNEYKQNEENIEIEEASRMKKEENEKQTTTLSELAQMQKEMDKALNLLKTKLEKLEDEQRNCTDYLRGFEALINTIQREQQQCNVEDDDFLREFLIKTAKRQYKKGQLNQAVDTFCQLLIATDGRLRVEEMILLVDVFREKQMNDSPYVMDELWGFVLEELRVDCAEAFEIVMVARGINRNRNNYSEEIGEEKKQKVEELKYLIGSIICALWLQITPYEHDEFEQIKELFLNALDRYYIISTTERIKNGQELLQDRNEIELRKSIRAALRQYPMLAYTKRMQKFLLEID